MKIGIFGGSFDPIHLGHIKIAKEAHHQYSLDKVVISPLNLTWEQKSNPKAKPTQRIKMCKLAIEGCNFLEVSSADIERGGVSRSIDTVNDIIAESQEGSLVHLIVGEDSATQIREWKDSGELLSKVKVLVAPRNFIGGKDLNKDFSWIDVDKMDVSSSTIRENIKMEKDWGRFVPPKVFDYIIKNKVYG
ncbi:MAG: nicotinate (nicotinamide) nucleotide adenylyltransferase [SAR202 cluster bacterium]|nr:nicotinate (nicotinamide) nucleotide adenylyltransferase [SAR202 cluster bacterium]|tara:strand:+ start:756 stop:1325 length:570 start_codon:yes stop_codon:yes gene_type:complete